MRQVNKIRSFIVHKPEYVGIDSVRRQMKAMSNDPTNFNYLLEYADMMTQYTDTMEKLDAIDETELSVADDTYYIEVMARIEVKLLEAANYMS